MQKPCPPELLDRREKWIKQTLPEQVYSKKFCDAIAMDALAVQNLTALLSQGIICPTE
jgi:hypothetical protein